MNQLKLSTEMSSWIKETDETEIKYFPNIIFCPLCEVLHDNNSNCQRSD